MTSLRLPLLLLLSLLSLSVWAADMPTRFDIPAQSLPEALRLFADQAKMQLLYKPGAISSAKSKAVVGEYEKRAALEWLLKDTGLEAVFTTSDSATIRPTENMTNRSSALSASAENAGNDEENSGGQDAPHSSESGQSSWARFRLAQATQGTSAERASVEKGKGEQTPQKGPVLLEEVVVTAQKKNEKLMDVPVPVTSISATELVENHQLRIVDYATNNPGFSVMPAPGQQQLLSIRGIQEGLGHTPTTGVLIDDVPYGSSQGAVVVPDIDPSDLSRIEVLRGPQGTLYGASSMGGLLKFVTVEPSTAGYSGRIDAGMSSVYNGHEPGYDVHGSANVPLGDNLAMVASAFTRQDPGYIDNPVLGTRGVNEAHLYGARLAVLWRPSDTLSLKVGALYQHTAQDGLNEVDVLPGLGDLQQNYIRGMGGSKKEIQAYNATLNAKLGAADLTVISGYNKNSWSDAEDYTWALGGPDSLTQSQFGVTGATLFDFANTEKYVEEVRLSTPIGTSFDWLVGAFYTHEDNIIGQSIGGEDINTGQLTGNGYTGHYLSTLAEYAAFTDLTYHVTDRFNVQIGGRDSEIQQTGGETLNGPYIPIFFAKPSGYVAPEVRLKHNAFTYLVTPQFKISPDFMVYARLASGYQPGGANVAAGIGTPTQFTPGKTQNYEIGAKGDFLNRRLSIDASLYYIDWKDLQITLTVPQTGFSYVGNAGNAKSEGAEFSIEAKPLQGLTVAAWVTYTDAVLTQAFPANSTTYGPVGSRLPYSSRLSGHLSLDEEFPLSNRVTGFVGGAVSYVGDRVGEFTGSALRQTYPDYVQVNAHAGMDYGPWTVNAYVNNVADKRAITGGGIGLYPPFAFTYILPRTMGVNLSRSF